MASLIHVPSMGQHGSKLPCLSCPMQHMQHKVCLHDLSISFRMVWVEWTGPEPVWTCKLNMSHIMANVESLCLQINYSLTQDDGHIQGCAWRRKIIVVLDLGILGTVFCAHTLQTPLFSMNGLFEGLLHSCHGTQHHQNDTEYSPPSPFQTCPPEVQLHTAMWLHFIPTHK